MTRVSSRSDAPGRGIAREPLNDAGAVARRMERIRADLQTASSSDVVADPPPPAAKAADHAVYAPVLLRMPFEAHPDGRYRLAELLAPHDDDFVRIAYLALLGREPDDEGRRHHLAELRDGASKVEILGRLRYSPEGRARAVHVDALGWRYALQRAYRVPLAGRLLQMLAAIAQGPTTIRNQRVFESHAMHLLERLQDASAAATHVLETQVRDARQAVGESEMRMHAALAAHAAVVGGLQREKADAADVVALREETLSAQRVERERLNAALISADAGLRKLAHTLDERHAALAADVAARAPASDVTALREAVEGLTARLRAFRDEARDDAAAERAEARRALDEATSALGRVLSEDFSARVGALASEMGGKASRDELRDAAAVLRSDVAALEAGLADAAGAFAACFEGLRAEALVQERRIARVLHEAGSRLPARIADAELAHRPAQDAHLLDAFYARLEERFRGSRNDIKARQSIYLPYVQAAMAEAGAGRVVDLGCGRGEWLEVMRDAGFDATGVDANEVFVATCTAAGLRVVDAEAVGYLGTLEDASVAVVSAFHLIEHLPLEALVRLLDEAHRVLRPGGRLILETPNPENLVVGACNFYLDPTHRHPLPPKLTQFVLEARGYGRIEVVPLHPVDPQWLQGQSNPAALTINHFIYGAQDYGVIARKA